MTHSPQNLSRNNLVDLEELLSRVRNANAAMALNRALTDSTESWDTTKHTTSLRLSSQSRNDRFEVSSRALADGYEVLSVGTIACSSHELASLLCTRDESDYNAAMKGLYGSQFIYGSVVQVIRSIPSQETIPDTHQLSVKTGCFARSGFLARNEQWCFLEYYQPTSDASKNDSLASDLLSQGFSISFVSLSEKEVNAGKAVGNYVDQLNNVSAFLVVDTVPAVSKDQSDGNATKLRIMFHARYHDSDKVVVGQASDKMVRNRLRALAKGIPRLPTLVRRRRLGTQVFAHASVCVAAPKEKARNPYCVSCTKSLRLSSFMRFARRCQLCAYNVCTACWVRENVETNIGHISALGVCKRCLEWVDRCDYSHIQVHRRGPVEIVEDPEPSQRLGQSLRGEMLVETTRQAAVSLIRMLLDPSESSSVTLGSDFSTDNEEVDEFMSAVDGYFDRRLREAPAAKDCALSNARQRNYPLHPMDSTSPSAPIPDNEVARLECIKRWDLMNLKGPIPELDIICSFLSKELGFFCSMITIVGETHQLILSCTIGDYVHALLPREHTFCQHLLMDDAPFIVRNPEADVRFYNLNPVKHQGIQYYCGIPITIFSGIMVGSICCVHTTAMDITRSQYDTLVQFGHIASKIIRVKAESKLHRIE